MQTSVATPTPIRTGPANRPLVVATGLVVGLVIVAVAAVLVVGQGAPRAYPVGSPEAAFQAYLTAYDADDLETAYAAFSARVHRTWDFDAYLRDTSGGFENPNERRVWIDSVTASDDQATLHLTIEWSSGSGIDASRWYDRDVQVRMLNENGGWFIDQQLVGVDRYY